MGTDQAQVEFFSLQNVAGDALDVGNLHGIDAFQYFGDETDAIHAEHGGGRMAGDLVARLKRER